MASEKLFHNIYDCATKLETIVEFTPEEYAAHAAGVEAALALEAERAAAKIAEEEAKASAIAKLEAVGLTADEIAALTK